MNKKAFTICLLLSLLMSVSAIAAPRTRQQAMQIAQDKAASLGVEFSMPTLVRRSAAIGVYDDENAPYFVFNNGSDNGWTIVSGDDRMPEVLGYSDEGALDMDDLPDGLQYLLAGFESYYNKIDSIEAANPTMVKAIRKASSSTTTSPIGPLCVTKWDQYEPYSNNCPTVSSGKHAATCCVATAFAQILYYLYYTKGKQESTTFTTAIPTPTNTVGYKGSAVAASDRTYEWSKMLTDYAGKDYTDEQAAAVAKLMADIGSSFNVKYGTTSSYSTTDDYMSSLTSSSYPHEAGPTYWGIADTDDLDYDGSLSTTTAWKTAIDGELDSYYPVQIGGNSHAFVCDGRDANNMYHMNFGYDGRGDGYYSLDACNGYNTSGSMRVTYGLRIESSTPSTGLEKLQIVYDAAKAYLDDEPVGNVPGNYRQEYYDALSALLATAKTYLNNDGNGKTDAELVALGEEISTAEHNLIDYRYPYPTGTYYLKSFDDHNGTDVVIYASGTSAKYGPISTSNDNYKWQITYSEDSNGYQIKNVGTGTYINSSSSSGVTLGSSSTVYTEITPVNRIEETNSRFTNSYWDVNYATTLRPITSSMSSSSTFIVISYEDGTAGSTSGSLTGWHPYNDWDVWIPVPIDVDYSTLPKPEASFAQSNVSIAIDETNTQKVTTNSDGAVTYTSSNTSVATVNSTTGEVTGVGFGTATIKATIAATDTWSSASAIYTITVGESSEIRSELDALIDDAKTLYTDDELAEAQDASVTTLSKATSITSGNKYIISYIDTDGTTYYLTSSGGYSTSSSDAGFFTLTTDGTTCYIQDSSNNYLQASSSNTLSFSSNSSSFTYAFAEDGTCQFYYTSGSNTYYLRIRSTRTSGFNIARYSDGSTLTLFEEITTPASADDQAIIDLNDAISTAESVLPATQDDIDALQTAIDAYYAKTENLKLIDKRYYLATKTGSYTSATYTRSVSYIWGTICLPYAIESNNDYQLYIPSTVGNGILTITPVASVEAGIPAIFKNVSGGKELVFAATTPTDVRACDYGKSKAYGKINMAATYRRLTGQSGIYFIAEDAFWKATTQNTVNVETYRSWLTVDDGSEDGSMLSIVVSDNVDGIDNITDAINTDAVIYNIAGQRVVTPQKGQIVIIGGKKVLVQ